MTEVAEKPQKVVLLCLGIACETGFALNPSGFDPSFANFKPDVPLELEKHYADYLIEADASRFEIVKTEKKEEKPPIVEGAKKKGAKKK